MPKYFTQFCTWLDVRFKATTRISTSILSTSQIKTLLLADLHEQIVDTTIRKAKKPSKTTKPSDIFVKLKKTSKRKNRSSTQKHLVEQAVQENYSLDGFFARAGGKIKSCIIWTAFSLGQKVKLNHALSNHWVSNRIYWFKDRAQVVAYRSDSCWQLLHSFTLSLTLSLSLSPSLSLSLSLSSFARKQLQTLTRKRLRANNYTHVNASHTRTHTYNLCVCRRSRSIIRSMSLGWQMTQP